MVYGTYKAMLSPISPMLTFLRVLGISGGFPMTPLASRISYDGTKFVSDENDRYSSSFSNSKSTYYVAETSWDSYHTFEIRTPRLIWCYFVNTLIWIIPLVIFLAISYVGCTSYQKKPWKIHLLLQLQHFQEFSLFGLTFLMKIQTCLTQT